DVIRDWSVTQAQTCPLPISADHRVGSVATDIAGYRSGGAQLHYRLIGVIWRFADKSANWMRRRCAVRDLTSGSPVNFPMRRKPAAIRKCPIPEMGTYPIHMINT